ncbi:DNA repair protein RAD5, partial [Tremellales sp. Uapishka_1]
MSPSPSPSPSPVLSKPDEPDLFFPASESEDEEIVPIAKRKVSPRRTVRSPSISLTNGKIEDDDIVPLSPRPGPSRKRSSPSSGSPPAVPAGFQGGYLGEFVCEGWSLSKGKGYCTPGSKIIFERPKPIEPGKNGNVGGVKTGPTKLVNGKTVNAKGKTAPKQMTLGAMGLGKKGAAALPRKGFPPKPVVDQIIRFRNERGFVGRLSVSEAGFLVHLLDTGVISLTGHVIDCPQILSTGTTILLNIKVFLTRDAFAKAEKVKGRAEEGSFWQEQKETAEEEAMRKRKEALGALFGRIGVKPLQSNALLMAQKKNGSAVINEKSLKHFDASARLPKRSQSPAKSSSSGGAPKGKAKASDDEDEDSGDEAEKLNDDQMHELDNIYLRAQQGDNRLEETDPPNSFLYTLRPYQKQALTWMNARETGDSTVRSESMHPLWEEYAFRKEQLEGQPIEIDDDDDFIDPSRKFYWNPYSGELSLSFPRSNTSSRGGILADAMGMGKTCMLSSLIHLNRQGDVPMEESTEPTTPDEPLSKRPKFVQVTLSNQWRAVPSGPRPTTTMPPRVTLVVCPVSLASQWHDELGKMSDKGSITSFMWYGNDRADVDKLLGQEGKKRIDVLITSYGTLASEFQKWKKNKDKPNYEGGSIYDYEFLRIVLDEAHNIKNRTAMVSKACYELKGQRRWALSGTPIVNRLDDLYSLLHFLRLEPWGHYSFFRSFVTIPFLNQDPKALNVVQYILESCLLRREKTMRDRDGKLIVDLPPKTVNILPETAECLLIQLQVDIQTLHFSRAERQIYKRLEDRAKRRFIELNAEGKALANYTSILAMLMKLRQCVDHPLLVMNKGTEDDEQNDRLLETETGGEASLKEMIAQYAGGSIEDSKSVDPTYALSVLKELGEAESSPECMICSQEIFDEVLLPCYHRGCQDCVVNWIGQCEDQNRPATCPTCDQGPIRTSDLRSVQRRRKRINPITGTFTDDNGLPSSQGDGETSVTLGRVDLASSTKLRALVRKLEEMRKEDPGHKVLVFSQFTSFLDLIERTLTKEGVRWLRFDGSMSQAQRAATIDEFGKKSKEPLILLISLKAGGVGLNLTMANHVFMMDTWWNEAIEQQAIDRVHRLGQNKPVFVTRYIIKGTVEKRIMKIQRSKTALVNASLSGGGQRDKNAAMADIKKIFGLDEEDSEDEAY